MRSDRFPIRSLLWFDCSAAAIAGVAMLSLSGVLAPWFAVPRALLITTALVNLAYGTFSFTLARHAEAPRGRVRALVVANFTWTILCAGLALVLALRGAPLAAIYFIGEGLFVAVLALVETRAVR
jgi:hypothetical protein